jgi:hypothetical protein
MLPFRHMLANLLRVFLSFLIYVVNSFCLQNSIERFPLRSDHLFEMLEGVCSFNTHSSHPPDSWRWWTTVTSGLRCPKVRSLTVGFAEFPSSRHHLCSRSQPIDTDTPALLSALSIYPASSVLHISAGPVLIGWAVLARKDVRIHFVRTAHRQ